MFQVKFHEEQTCLYDLLQDDHRQNRARLICDMIKEKYKQRGKSVYVSNSINQDMTFDYGIDISYRWLGEQGNWLLKV